MPEFRERINVAPLARKYREEGYPSGSPSFDEFGNLPLPNSDKARAMWAQYKPETYAIGADFADKVVRFAYEQRDIDGMIRTIAEGNQRPSPFFVLGQEIHKEILLSIQYNCEQIEKGNEPHCLPAYKRLDKLIKLQNALTPQDRNTVKGYLEGGVNTAVTVMSGSLDVIVPLVGSVDQQRIINIAENSFPLIAKLASSHAQATLSVIHTIQGIPLNFMPFNPKYFALEKRNGRESLVFSEEGTSMVEAETGVSDIQAYRTDSPIIGCIAMVNFGDGSAVKKMWDWHLEALKVMAPRFRPGRADK